MKKLTGLLVLLSMVCFTVFAGGNKETAAAAPTRTTPISEYPIKSDKPITLKVWFPMIASLTKYITTNADAPVFQQLEKETGIKIEWIHPVVGQEQEQFNLMLASGDLPDIIIGGQYYRGGEFQGMEDGVFLDITDLIPIYAPDYYKVIQENKDFYREITNDKGRIPAVYSMKLHGDPPFQRIILREDVLKEIGSEIPTKLSDFEPMFQKMLAKGITPYALAKNGYEEQFMGPFDVWAGLFSGGARAVNDGFYRYTDNKIKFGAIEPNFKKYLELMNDWYKKGYISKDFTTLDSNQLRTLFDTKKIGMMTDAIVANFNRAATQGFTVTAAPYPRTAPDQKLHYERNDASPKMAQHQTMAVITKNSKNVEAALRFLNFGYTVRGIELFNWGIEGVNYTKVNGKNVYNDTMLNNPKFGTEEASYYYKAHFFPKLTFPDTQVHANLLKSPAALASRQKWSPDANMDSYFHLPNIQLTSDELTRRTKIMTDVSTYTNEMVLKFIIGAAPLSDFDKYVQTIKGMGIDEAIKITQNAYDRYMKK